MIIDLKTTHWVFMQIPIIKINKYFKLMTGPICWLVATIMLLRCYRQGLCTIKPVISNSKHKWVKLKDKNINQTSKRMLPVVTLIKFLLMKNRNLKILVFRIKIKSQLLKKINLNIKSKMITNHHKILDNNQLNSVSQSCNLTSKILKTMVWKMAIHEMASGIQKQK